MFKVHGLKMKGCKIEKYCTQTYRYIQYRGTCIYDVRYVVTAVLTL